MYMYKKKSRHFENLSGIIITKIKKKKFLIHYVEAGYIVYYIWWIQIEWVCCLEKYYFIPYL